MEQNEIVGKVSGTVLKSVKLAWVWVVSFVKIRACRFKLHKAQKNLDARTATLGMEFYALHRRGDTQILTSLVILQQLKIVEEAESRVLELQGRIDAIREEYRKKWDEISAGHNV